MLTSETDELCYCRVCVCSDVFCWVLVYPWTTFLYRSGDEEAVGSHGC